jgi:hypothetical protein
MIAPWNGDGKSFFLAKKAEETSKTRGDRSRTR